MELFTYYHSSAAYRVRIALNLKNLSYIQTPINLVADEQRSSAYLNSNPQGLVPALRLDSGEVISQSGAILEWLEETHPSPPLYASDPIVRAEQRALCQHIACDIHPLNNLRVLRYLKGPLSHDQNVVNQWYAHWVSAGFESLEAEVAGWSAFSLGGHPGMFEAFLIPQVFNARRFAVDLSAFPALCALDEECLRLDSFSDAHPLRQADAP